MIIGFGAFRLTDIGMGGLPDLQWWTNAGGGAQRGGATWTRTCKGVHVCLVLPLFTDDSEYVEGLNFDRGFVGGINISF